MPKVDADISEEYGEFVKHQAENFIPYGNREITVFQYSPGIQWQYEEYMKEFNTYQDKLNHELNKEYRESLWVWFFGTNFLKFSKKFTEKYMQKSPPPELPKVIANSKRKEMTIKDSRNSLDDIYDKYIEKKKFYQTVTSCPICNSTIQFSNVRKVPFEDKCKECNYSFTFVYRKFVERYYTTHTTTTGGDYVYRPGKYIPGKGGFLNPKPGRFTADRSYFTKTKTKTKKTAHYIEYNGIKPTRARSPSKSRNVSGTKRKSIPKDIKNDVWNRDDGKCVECGSKENLEFDHIIPVAKGGANTYRNLQLLCEICNREKSDNIG